MKQYLPHFRMVGTGEEMCVVTGEDRSGGQVASQRASTEGGIASLRLQSWYKKRQPHRWQMLHTKAQVKRPPIQERWPVKMPPPLAGHCRWHQSKHRLQCEKMTTERNTYNPTCLVTDVRQSRRSLRCYETWKAATPAVPSKTSSEWSKTVKGMVRNGAECCRKVRMMKCGSRRWVAQQLRKKHWSPQQVLRGRNRTHSSTQVKRAGGRQTHKKKAMNKDGRGREVGKSSWHQRDWSRQ